MRRDPIPHAALFPGRSACGRRTMLRASATGIAGLGGLLGGRAFAAAAAPGGKLSRSAANRAWGGPAGA